MNTNGMERRLSAIMSTDVKDFARLMRDDETATVRTLTVYKEVMEGFINQYYGRVVDSPGDNLLAEFTSALNAVQCAVAIQDELKYRRHPRGRGSNLWRWGQYYRQTEGPCRTRRYLHFPSHP
jgi:adenylate cyclase